MVNMYGHKNNTHIACAFETEDIWGHQSCGNQLGTVQLVGWWRWGAVVVVRWEGEEASQPKVTDD